jgi:hypothetical protein
MINIIIAIPIPPITTMDVVMSETPCSDIRLLVRSALVGRTFLIVVLHVMHLFFLMIMLMITRMPDPVS